MAESAVSLGWDALKGFGELALKALWHSVFWGLLGLLAGATAGVFLWRALRDRGWMDVPWGWYRYVRWLWPVLLVGTLSLGLGTTLSLWGGGRAIKQGAREGAVVETAVMNTYSALMVWRLKDGRADANGTALLEQDLAGALSRLRTLSAGAQSAEQTARERVLAEVDEQAGGSRLQRTIARKVVLFLWDEQLKGGLTDHEAVELLQSVQSGKVSSAEVVAVAKQKILGAVHVAMDEMVNSFVYPMLVTVGFVVMGMLGGPLGAFWLVRWLALRRRGGETGASQRANNAEPPLLKDAE